MKKTQHSSSKRKKVEHQIILLVHAAIKKLGLRMLSKLSPSAASPTPDHCYSPGALLHADFSFYDTTSMRGYSAVFDAICASASHPWAFPTRSKRSPISITLWLIKVIEH